MVYSLPSASLRRCASGRSSKSVGPVIRPLIIDSRLRNDVPSTAYQFAGLSLPGQPGTRVGSSYEEAALRSFNSWNISVRTLPTRLTGPFWHGGDLPSHLPPLTSHQPKSI